MAMDGTSGAGPRRAMFARLDADGSGALERKELEELARRISERTGQTVTADQLLQADANGDGALGQDELPAPKGPPPGWEDASSYGMGSRPNPFSHFDADGSGSLSASELQAMAQRIGERSGQNLTGEDMLQKLDGDGDGSVSPSELEVDIRNRMTQHRLRRR